MGDAVSKSLPGSTYPEADPSAGPHGKKQSRWHNIPGRLALAFTASLVAHALITEWPVNLEPAAPLPPPLAVRLEKMPPPPLPAARPVATKPPRKIITRPAHARTHPAPIVEEPPPVIADASQFSPPAPKTIEPTPPVVVAPPPS